MDQTTSGSAIERFGWVVRATSISPCLLAFESCAHTTPNPLALRSEWKPAEILWRPARPTPIQHCDAVRTSVDRKTGRDHDRRHAGVKPSAAPEDGGEWQRT